MLYNFKDLETKERYKLISQAVIPRPIAWIITEQNGILNIAPFSYFIPLSSNPPALIVSIGHKEDGSPKDTLHNLRESKKCVICMAEVAQKDTLICTSESLPSSESEAKHCGIPTDTIFDDFPPMIKEAKVAFFCNYSKEVTLEESETIPVILKVEHMYIDDKIIDKEKLSFEFDALARVGHTFAKLHKI